MAGRRPTNLLPSMEIHTADVEAVYVRWNYRKQEKDAVQHTVVIQAGQHRDREGWTEYVQ